MVDAANRALIDGFTELSDAVDVFDILRLIVNSETRIHESNGMVGKLDYLDLLSDTLHMVVSDATIEHVNTISENGRVIVHNTLRGRHTGEFAGVPPSGREFETPVIVIFEFEDGEVTDLWLLVNFIGTLMFTAGLLPAQQAA